MPQRVHAPFNFRAKPFLGFVARFNICIPSRCVGEISSLYICYMHAYGASSSTHIFMVAH